MYKLFINTLLIFGLSSLWQSGLVMAHHICDSHCRHGHHCYHHDNHHHHHHMCHSHCHHGYHCYTDHDAAAAALAVSTLASFITTTEILHHSHKEMVFEHVADQANNYLATGEVGDVFASVLKELRKEHLKTENPGKVITQQEIENLNVKDEVNQKLTKSLLSAVAKLLEEQEE